MMLWISLSCTLFMLVYRKNEIENLKNSFLLAVKLLFFSMFLLLNDFLQNVVIDNSPPPLDIRVESIELYEAK